MNFKETNMTLIPFILALGMALFFLAWSTQRRDKIAILARAKDPVSKFTFSRREKL
jgi:hypothetical protein